MTKVRCISSAGDCERIFQLLNEIRPNDISFSRMLAKSADEYIVNHKNDKDGKISDFVEKNINGLTPSFFADIDLWKKVIEKLPPSEIKKIKVRHRQIDNIIRKRIEEFL